MRRSCVCYTHAGLSRNALEGDRFSTMAGLGVKLTGSLVLLIFMRIAEVYKVQHPIDVSAF